MAVAAGPERRMIIRKPGVGDIWLNSAGSAVSVQKEQDNSWVGVGNQGAALRTPACPNGLCHGLR